MRYAIISVIVLAVCLAVGWVLANAVARRSRRTWPLLVRVLFSLCLTLLIAGGCVLGYVSRYYHADATALSALSGSSEVQVVHDDGGYFFDGPQEGSLMVFLPGAKVQSEAYAPLMLRLAERGVDCLLVDPPAHFAPLGLGVLERLVAAHPSDRVILAGHSLGGYVAASYVSSHQDVADGLVLLAAYPGKALPKDLHFLSLYGSDDGVLERGQYESGRVWWPSASREVVLSGANHAGFGNYGTQTGDGVASISCDEQQEQVAQAVCELVDELEEDA